MTQVLTDDHVSFAGELADVAIGTRHLIPTPVSRGTTRTGDELNHSTANLHAALAQRNN